MSTSPTAYTSYDIIWMRRALSIARHGLGEVRTNPLVGSVLASDSQLISEGYHEYYGGFHAERNALNKVTAEKIASHTGATLYVTLEPCNHHGKTPPCTDIIITKGIKRVIVCQLDPNPQMSGKSIQLLKNHGIEVHVGLMKTQGQELNRAFITNQKKKRPYIILKYARSQDGFMGQKDKQIWLSSEEAKTITHRWRSEIDAILVGSETVLTDDPKLTTRAYPGKSPLRVIIDRRGRVTSRHKAVADHSPSLLYTEQPSSLLASCQTVSMPNLKLNDVLLDLHQRGIGTVMVEGGATVLTSFIKKKLWDEARIITTKHGLNNGIKAPIVTGKKIKQYKVNSDIIEIIYADDDCRS